MKTIYILVLETAVPASIFDPRYMFSAINMFFKNDGRLAPFHIQLVGLTKEVKLAEGSVIVQTDGLINEVKKADLVIIPALGADLNKALELNQEVIPWLIKQYKNGTELASLCIGAFLLAATGLLNGKNCSTHWLFSNDFRTLYPEVNLVDDRIITDQNGLYTSGGATSYWNLLLYLVEKYVNREKAIMASKFFLLDMDRNTQSVFMMFRGQRLHGDCEILKVQDYIEHHFEKKLSVDDLSNQFGIGRRTFERRFKKATQNTVIEYQQRVKIEAAKKQLEHGRKTVNEVMFEVGYADVKAFRDVFKKYAGLSPVDYRGKYNQQLL